MINLEEKIIKFGYDDLFILANKKEICIYESMDEIRTILKDNKNKIGLINEQFKEKLDNLNIKKVIIKNKDNELCKLLSAVTEDNSIFEYDGFIFDFSHYRVDTLFTLINNLQNYFKINKDNKQIKFNYYQISIDNPNSFENYIRLLASNIDELEFTQNTTIPLNYKTNSMLMEILQPRFLAETKRLPTLKELSSFANEIIMLRYK